MASEFQEVHFDRAAFDRVFSTIPSARIAEKWQQARRDGFVEIIWDSIRYPITIGEHKLLPREVAVAARKQGAVFADYRSGDPIYVLVLGAESSGAIKNTEMCCTAPGCGAGPFTSFIALSEHFASHAASAEGAEIEPASPVSE